MKQYFAVEEQRDVVDGNTYEQRWTSIDFDDDKETEYETLDEAVERAKQYKLAWKVRYDPTLRIVKVTRQFVQHVE